MSTVQLFAVTPDGPQPLPLPREAKSVHELLDDLPIGVYTALRTFEHHMFLYLEDHLDRLECSMSQLDWDYQLDRLALRRALHQVCTTYPWPNARVRLDVLAESAAQLGTASRVLISLAPFEPIPQRLYQEGVRVGIAWGLSRKEPSVKQAKFVLQRRQYLQAMPSVYECLMVDESDRLLEGTTSNFYGVRDGVLCTAGSGVLEGIARKIVLRIADELAIPLRLDAIRVREIPALAEAALSSASRGVIPVVKLNEQIVGDGGPGPITKRLISAYNHFVARQIRPAI